MGMGLSVGVGMAMGISMGGILVSGVNCHLSILNSKLKDGFLLLMRWGSGKQRYIYHWGLIYSRIFLQICYVYSSPREGKEDPVHE